MNADLGSTEGDQYLNLAPKYCAGTDEGCSEIIETTLRLPFLSDEF